MKRDDIIGGLVLIVAAIIVIALLFTTIFMIVIGGAWLSAGVRLNQEYQTTGHIRLYEHSSWISPHTWIVLETYGGIEADLTLIGYHDFEVGKLYEIKTICKRGGFFNAVNWYEVIEIRCLGDTEA